MTIPNRDLHLTNIGNLAQALLTTAANLNMEVDHLTRQPPTGDGQTGSEDWQQQRTEMETELARLRETNAHQRTQLADYHRVYNENKASHELLESRVQELLKRWSNDVANRDQQLRIRSVHRFWNWLGKTCAMVNPKSVTVLCEAYSVLLREGAPTAPQTNDIVKIPPFTAKASAPVYVLIKYQALPSTNEIEGRAIGAGAVTALDTAAITPEREKCGRTGSVFKRRRRRRTPLEESKIHPRISET
ncbi:hypothetical protein H257_18182 [Aphanomyces astaci]|uniref:Uncharacterized protein n=1 Tax=Aphanomyces astaci TaxID=112090 RepID=W4FDR7_APHAT|nr:hypothetical protein H257_18182 [Aphanomyces astaci]ETV65029.1 hypothetical protein H257_18182 [Aphanomyces astaci]|eukprot:XP_009845492.1 hypothetical protein H257_18182 [Aphanomyces astaci]